MHKSRCDEYRIRRLQFLLPPQRKSHLSCIPSNAVRNRFFRYIWEIHKVPETCRLVWVFNDVKHFRLNYCARDH